MSLQVKLLSVNRDSKIEDVLTSAMLQATTLGYWFGMYLVIACEGG